MQCKEKEKKTKKKKDRIFSRKGCCVKRFLSRSLINRFSGFSCVSDPKKIILVHILILNNPLCINLSQSRACGGILKRSLLL